jgi:hypothetical protein
VKIHTSGRREDRVRLLPRHVNVVSEAFLRLLSGELGAHEIPKEIYTSYWRDEHGALRRVFPK